MGNLTKTKKDLIAETIVDVVPPAGGRLDVTLSKLPATAFVQIVYPNGASTSGNVAIVSAALSEAQRGYRTSKVEKTGHNKYYIECGVAPKRENTREFCKKDIQASLQSESLRKQCLHNVPLDR